MATVLNLQLNDISPQLLFGLTEQYGQEAKVEIRVKQKKTEKWLSEAQFWNIIDALDWKAKDKQTTAKAAAILLAAMPIGAIYLFADKVAEKLFALDTKLHAIGFSSDSFLYARCAVVAEGKDFYEKVLHNPIEMPENLSFEPLLNIADIAFELKTGEVFNYFPNLNIETGSNKKAWK
jgi:hypothetical protein